MSANEFIKLLTWLTKPIHPMLNYIADAPEMAFAYLTYAIIAFTAVGCPLDSSTGDAEWWVPVALGAAFGPAILIAFNVMLLSARRALSRKPDQDVIARLERELELDR